MAKSALIAMMLLGTGLFAALPPLAQSSREIKAILESPELYQHLSSGDLIECIRRTEGGYLIETNHGQLAVEVVYSGKAIRPGPIPFEIRFPQ